MSFKPQLIFLVKIFCAINVLCPIPGTYILYFSGSGGTPDAIENPKHEDIGKCLAHIILL